MVTVLFRVCGSVSDVVDVAAQLKANKALDVAFVDKTDEKPAATSLHEPRKRRRVGLRRSSPGQRVMDYVLTAMQTDPDRTWAVKDLIPEVIDAGCPSSKAKLVNGLYPCLSTMKIKLGLVEQVEPSTYRLTKSGKACSLPIPFTMSGEPL